MVMREDKESCLCMCGCSCEANIALTHASDRTRDVKHQAASATTLKQSPLLLAPPALKPTNPHPFKLPLKFAETNRASA